ncbi:hypothetical protein BDD12DRAFT_806991 [Trichophaea hybrida]|nr:hypothetical protein BDD12DRAFT_806991 [Trichophaea hybrida]
MCAVWALAASPSIHISVPYDWVWAASLENLCSAAIFGACQIGNFHAASEKTKYNLPKNNHVFAVIVSSISIDPTLNDQSLDLAWDAVNSHLCLLIAVDWLTGLVKTSTPSVPIIVDSVTTIFIGLENCNTAQTSNMWIPSIRTFTNQPRSRGLVDMGTRSKLYTRFVLILSRDVLATQHAGQYLQTDTFILSSPLCYKDFLQNTFGDSLFAVIQATMSNTPIEFPEITVDLVSELAQQWWNLLIPLYHDNLSNNVDLKEMSALLTQVKNQIHKKAQKLTTFCVQSFGEGCEAEHTNLVQVRSLCGWCGDFW